ncbi:MAG: hypothetical protein ACK5PP_15705, partial [Acidimicrobiales bacterium]
SPELGVELPNTGQAWLGTVKDMVDRFTALGFVISLVGLALSLLITDDRGAGLRRMGRWAIGSAAFWLLVGLAMPYILQQVAPSAAVLVASAIDVFFGAMITPALILAGIGAIVMAAGYLWPSYDRRRPAAMVSRRGRNRVAAGGEAPAPNPAATPTAGGRAVTATFNPPGAAAAAPATPSRPGGPERTQAFPTITSRPADAPAATGPPAAGPAPHPAATAPAPSPAATTPNPAPNPAASPTAPAAPNPAATAPIPLTGSEAPAMSGGGDDRNLRWVEGIGYTEADLSPDGLPNRGPVNDAPTGRPGPDGAIDPTRSDTRRIG